MPDHDPSIHSEPQLRKQSFERDPSEARAERRLKSTTDPIDEAHLHSVHDELAIRPDSAGRPIDTDWLCMGCGYNLRGLSTGMPCPECGHVEFYAPPPPDAPSYGWWLREKQRRVAPAWSWAWVFMGAVIGGPLAIFGALFNASGMGLLSLCVVGPVVEEVVKVATAVLTVETRPYLIRKPAQIWVMTLVSATIFATLENLVYLNVYINNPSPTVVAWRWTVCMVLHIGCTAVATQGVLSAWTQCVQQFRRPRLSDHARPIITAAIIHGVYNLTVFMLQYTSAIF